MISVEHLTKRYARTLAVDDVSFEVNSGEIVGFLGPNGAGKSTTMRILAGYLPATGGQVRIGNLDVTRESLEVRRRLGYLPESCPLYTEMRVQEYLHYRANVKGVAHRHRKRRVGTVMEQCDLEGVRRKPISQLSKGFRQRVGIADALVHNPDLLILDEPTIGLDPNQIRQVRGLIRQLSEEHTILLSTHILSEVEATCDRVIIINEGKIVESASLEGLQKKWCPHCRISMEVRVQVQTAEMGLRALPGLQSVVCKELDGGWIHCTMDFNDSPDTALELFNAVKMLGWPLRELTRLRQSLEEVFVSITAGDMPPPTAGAESPSSEVKG